MTRSPHRPFWTAPRPSAQGLTPPQTVRALSRLLGDAPAKALEETPSVPDRPAAKEDRGTTRVVDGPAVRVEMAGGTVAVRRGPGGLRLGVLMDDPADGAGLCFTARRSPAAVRELVNEGIIL